MKAIDENKDKAVEKAKNTLRDVRKILQEYKDQADNLIELSAVTDLEESALAIAEGLGSQNKNCYARVNLIDVCGDHRLDIEFTGLASDNVDVASDILCRIQGALEDPRFVATVIVPVALRENELMRLSGMRSDGLKMIE